MVQDVAFSGKGAEVGKDFKGELFGACNIAGHAVMLEAYVMLRS